MSWLELHPTRRFAVSLAGIVCLAGLTAGCFQPLYGDHTLTGGPGVGPALAAVDVAQISAPAGSSEARVAVELRNQLLFDIRGGAEPPPPTHRLTIRMTTMKNSLIVDVNSGLPNEEEYGLNVYFTLTDIKTGKTVVTGQSFARVTYDIPGFTMTQRFTHTTAIRDAEDRAAKQIADAVRSRLASYFVAGT
jgi:LPS-assembly lipoprotein